MCGGNSAEALAPFAEWSRAPGGIGTVRPCKSALPFALYATGYAKTFALA